MIAAGLRAPAGSDVGIRIARLASLAGSSFDRRLEGDGWATGACRPGMGDVADGSVWIGCEPQPLSGSLADLRGPFAFVAPLGDELVLGRGRMGGHPLFYGRDRDGAVLVCSRLAPLARLLGRDSAIHPDRLGELLTHATGSATTLYRGICRLRSGEIIRIRTDREESSRLPTPSPRRDAPWQAAEAAERLRELVTASVARCVGSSKRVGVLVGGLDSSGLLATTIARARGASKAEAVALTWHFAGPGDDRRHVSDLCRALAIEPVRIKPADCGARVLSPVAIDASPLPWPQSSWMLESAQQANDRGIDVLLTGEGGDYLFDGDFSVFADDLLKGHLIRGVRNAMNLRGVPFWSSPSARLSALVVRPVVQRLFPRCRRLIHKVRARRQIATDFRWAGPALRPWLNRRLWSDGDRPVPTSRGDEFLDIRESFEHMRLHTGCRFSEPYLDDDLLSFVTALPKQLLFSGGYRRGLFRLAFRGLLPESVRLREDKSGFGHALAEVFLAAGGEKVIAPYASMGHLADLGFIEPRAFRAEIDALVRNPTEPRQWVKVWPPLAVEAFLTHLHAANEDLPSTGRSQSA